MTINEHARNAVNEPSNLRTHLKNLLLYHLKRNERENYDRNRG